MKKFFECVCCHSRFTMADSRFCYLIFAVTLHCFLLFAHLHSAVVHTTDVDFSSGVYTGLGATVQNGQVQLGPAGAEAMHFVSSTSCNLTLLSDKRSSHAMSVWNGKLYITGGMDGTGLQRNTVWVAPINADGTVGGWMPQTQVLPVARYSHAMCVWNGRLYVTGGWGDGSPNTCWVATINADGTVGGWVPQAGVIPARYGHAMSVWNGRLYITGGLDSGVAQSTILVAPINADGTVGGWVTQTQVLPAACYYHAMSIWNGRLYITGGRDGSNVDSNTVWVAPINADGTVGGWVPQTQVLPAARNGHTMSIWNGQLYVTGGYGGGYQNTCWMASINTNGTIGNWTTLNIMPGSRAYHAASVWNGRLYVTGGFSAGNSSYDTVWMAPLNSDGTVNGWNDLTSTAPLPRDYSGPAMCIWNGRLYISGGGSSGNGIWMAPINADGTITAGSWTDLTLATPLPTLRTCHAMVAWNGRLYITGGWLSGNSQRTVWMAPIKADGTLVEWKDLTPSTPLPANRIWHAMCAWNDRLYITGGEDNTQPSPQSRNTVWTASIKNDGTINTWQDLTPSAQLPITLSNHPMCVWNGKLYIAGGNSNNWPYTRSNAWMSQINADGTIGSWTPISALPDVRLAHQMNVLNNQLYVTGGSDGTYNGTHQSTVWTAPLNADGTITGSWTTITSSLLAGRCRHLMCAWNGRLYVAGGLGLV